MSPNLMRSYYHGEYAWQNRVLDVSEACEENISLQRKSLKLQAKGQEATQEQHEQMLSVAEAQSSELMGLRAAQEEIRSGQEEMTNEIRRGMSVIADRLDEQIQLFSQALTKLDEINQTLKIPRATEANELYSQGERWFRQGLYEESLDAYLKTEQIYKVHYLLQFRIGSLFLEGRNRRSNVIDLSRAEPHLLLATRYAEIQDRSDSRAQKICGDAYFRAGKTAYLLAEDKGKVGDLDGVQTCLQRALGHLAKSVEFWPENTATIYWQAKCYALLGEKQEVLTKFAILSDRNRKYHADAMEDGDFQALQNDIRTVFTQALDSPGPQARAGRARISAAQAQLSKTFEALAWARRSSAETESQNARLQAVGNTLSEGEEQLLGLGIDIDYLLLRLDHIRHKVEGIRRELDDLTERTLKARAAAIEQQLLQLHSQKTTCESRINSYRREMSETPGSGGVGCLFVFIFGVIFGVCFLLLMISLADEHGHYDLSPGQITLVLFVLLAWLVLGNATGLWITRKSKNSPLQGQLDTAISALAEWNRTAPSAIQQLNAALEAQTKQTEQFSLWRKSNPIVLKS